MPRCFALIPCAGAGRRAGTEEADAFPKQYWLLQGKPMVWHALTTLGRYSAVAKTLLILAPDDKYFAEQLNAYGADLDGVMPREAWQVHYCGGETRQRTVMNGLTLLAQSGDVQEDDWVLVHDAARPGLTTAMLDRLMNAIKDHPVGGILATPVTDTLKHAERTTQYASQITQTLAREDLWQAQTPQIFRFGLLQQAMQRALEQGEIFTDEASAIEGIGLKPLLVQGSLRNLKVTYANDLIFIRALMGVGML